MTVYTQTVNIGSSFEQAFVYTRNDEPVNLTGWGAVFRLRDQADRVISTIRYGDTGDRALTIASSVGQINVTMAASATSGILPGVGTFELEIYDLSNTGRVFRIIDGAVRYRPRGRAMLDNTVCVIRQTSNQVTVETQEISSYQRVDRGPPGTVGPAGPQGNGVPSVDDELTVLFTTSSGRTFWDRIVITPEQFAPAGVTLGQGNKTDDQAAWNLALAAAKSRGNVTIRVAFGRTYTLDNLLLDGAEGVLVEGFGGKTFNHGGFVFDGVDPRIRFQSCLFCGIRGVRISVTHSSLTTTDFIMCDHGLSGADSSGIVIDDVALLGPSDGLLKSFFNGKQLINWRLTSCSFFDCQTGIDVGTDGYSVRGYIHDNVFSRVEVPVYNPDERITVCENTFEPRLSDGNSVGLWSNRYSLALNVTKNWFGDAIANNATNVYLYSPFGCEVNCNRVKVTGGGNTFVKVRGGEGVKFGDGNRVECTYGLEFVGPETTLGAVVGPNSFAGVAEIKNLDPYGSVAFAAKLAYFGGLSMTFDSFSVQQMLAQFITTAQVSAGGATRGITVDSVDGLQALGQVQFKPATVTVASGVNPDLDSLHGIVFLSGAGAAFSTDGWLQGANGQLFFALNLTGKAWTVPHESASETNPARRIITPTGANMTDLASKGMGIFIRDATASRFRFYPLYGF